MSLFEHFNGQFLNAHEKADHAIGLLEGMRGDIAQMLVNAEADSNRKNYQRIPSRAAADGTNIAQHTIMVPVGTAYDLVSLSWEGVAAGSQALVYLGSVDGGNLIAAPPAAQRGTFVFPGEEYVPAGNIIIINIVGQNPGDATAVNLKVQRLPEA